MNHVNFFKTRSRSVRKISKVSSFSAFSNNRNTKARDRKKWFLQTVLHYTLSTLYWGLVEKNLTSSNGEIGIWMPRCIKIMRTLTQFGVIGFQRNQRKVCFSFQSSSTRWILSNWSLVKNWLRSYSYPISEPILVFTTFYFKNLLIQSQTSHGSLTPLVRKWKNYNFFKTSD